MYIFKNALRCISRAKGRNVLIGVIVLVIAVSACVGLSIRQAAESAREETLAQMSVSATISYDRMSAMEDMTPPEQPSTTGGEQPTFDKGAFSELMNNSSALTLEEYETYAALDSVKDFYYTLTVSIDGSDALEPVSTSTEASTDNGADNMPSMGGGREMNMGSSSDFQIIGYSSDSAMTDFVDGNASISDGAVFDEGTEQAQCIITDELAAYNDLGVGDNIVVTNPNNEQDVYNLTVVGIYKTTSSTEQGFSMMSRGMTGSDPANQIYMSYAALDKIVSTSETVNDDEDDDTEPLSGSLEATYSFADVASYEKFSEQVYEAGLDEAYTVSSSDITAFENSLTPLTTLSTMAGWFLLVILIIGAIILIVLNIFNVRERKYEIGVLTAMGMKKSKVALQFLTEIFCVTLIAVMIGALIGGVCAVPVTNVLLEAQTTSRSDRSAQMDQNFGRENGGMMGGSKPSDIPDNDGGGKMGEMFDAAGDYITEINSAMNFTVVLQMLGIAILLTLAAGAVSMLFVMRYEPLKILANRD